MISRQERMYHILFNHFSPSRCEIQNDSYKHRVPPNSETHFSIVMVSESFHSLTRVKRHLAIMSLLQDEFKTGLHALSIQAYTETEWQRITPFQVPNCQHIT